jgi:hypothetical protein
VSSGLWLLVAGCWSLVPGFWQLVAIQLSKGANYRGFFKNRNSVFAKIDWFSNFLAF